MHPVDRLATLEEFITSLPGEEREFPHSMKLSENARLICGKNVTVQPFLAYDGIIYLADDTFVGPHCFLRGPLYLGRYARVGPHSEITRSFIDENSEIGHQNIVPDSVIGRNAWFAGGVIVANLKLDKSHIAVKGKTVPKFGLYAEDNVTLGVRTTVMPGTNAQKNTRVYGPATIQGTVT